MAKIAIITGISGQDGTYLSKLLIGKKYKVIGITNPKNKSKICLLYTSPSPRDGLLSRMPSSA